MTPVGLHLVIATRAGHCPDAPAWAAAVGVAAATGDDGGVVVAESTAERSRRPTLLSSTSARELEESLRATDVEAAARGRVCWARLDAEDPLPGLVEAIAAARTARAVVAYLEPSAWRHALEDDRFDVRAALLRADLSSGRSLVALVAHELREGRVAMRVATRTLGPVGARRALAGLDPGGPASARAARIAAALVPARTSGPEPTPAVGQRGQSLPMVLGAAFAVLFVAMVLAALGAALTASAREQRTADLAALSAARSMRDDVPRLMAPERLPNGRPNPAHLEKSDYLARAQAAAQLAARRNGAHGGVEVHFPDASEGIPLRARVEVDAERNRWAEAIASAPAPTGLPTTATGGGYSGPLVYRQGKPMRPDVARAFDRLAAAAARAGHRLVITSAYRSDAEQARLFAQNPDPRWVARPGTSLHRCATELDLGPSSAYGWLAANARRFGFLRRYPWEPWHYGFVTGPAPCSAAANRAAGDGAVPPGVPSFVPAAHRAPLLRAAARWNVSARLLAAQLQAESGFNPRAVSLAGARGIAQFMPATAAAYGLRDPFDPAAAIDAQAHLMSDLLRQFGSVQLALAAYNAGPGAVAACDCVPPYAETQAYVARIMAMLNGAGEWAEPLEVRLVA